MAEAEHKALMAQLTDLAVLRESNTALRCVSHHFSPAAMFLHTRANDVPLINHIPAHKVCLRCQNSSGLSVLPSGRLQGPLLRDSCPHATVGEGSALVWYTVQGGLPAARGGADSDAAQAGGRTGGAATPAGTDPPPQGALIDAQVTGSALAACRRLVCPVHMLTSCRRDSCSS